MAMGDLQPVSISSARVLVPYVLGIALTASATALACFAYLKRLPPMPEQCIERVELIKLDAIDERIDCPGGLIDQRVVKDLGNFDRWLVECHCGTQPVPTTEAPDASAGST